MNINFSSFYLSLCLSIFLIRTLSLSLSLSFSHSHTLSLPYALSVSASSSSPLFPFFLFYIDVTNSRDICGVAVIYTVKTAWKSFRSSVTVQYNEVKDFHLMLEQILRKNESSICEFLPILPDPKLFTLPSQQSDAEGIIRFLGNFLNFRCHFMNYLNCFFFSYFFFIFYISYSIFLIFGGGINSI